MEQRRPSIFVYRLVEPTLVEERAPDIARALFDMSSLQDGAKRFWIAPASGCMSFVDDAELWRSTATSSPPSQAEAARKIAQQFIEEAPQKLRDDRRKKYPAIFPIYPARLEHLETKAAPARGRTGIDHWLSRWMAYLSTGVGDEAVPVENGIVDIRVGARGKIIGVWSNWRPLAGAPQSEERLSPPKGIEAPAAHGPSALAPINKPSVAGNEQDAHARAELVYSLAGTDEPQRFLAPYYLLNDGHSSLLWPASGHSLLVRIGKRETSDGVELRALVVGPRALRDVRYHWARWRPDVGWSGRFEELSTSGDARLEAGVHNVVLTVEDRRTKAIAQTQAMIYARKSAAGVV